MESAVKQEAGRPKVQRARDKIFAVAADLFYREGIRAVGVETIVRQAGVTKISLYRSFSSKDDLIVAYLEERSRLFLQTWDERFDPLQGDPHAQLRAIMTYLTERTTAEGYRGCPFINFCAEFPDPQHPGRKVARATKAALRDRLLKIAMAMKVNSPAPLADGLLLLVEGAYALSQTFGGGGEAPGLALLSTAEALVASQLRTSDQTEASSARSRIATP